MHRALDLWDGVPLSDVPAVGDGTWALSEGTPAAGRKHGLLTDAMNGTYRIDAGVLTVEVSDDRAVS